MITDKIWEGRSGWILAKSKKEWNYWPFGKKRTSSSKERWRDNREDEAEAMKEYENQEQKSEEQDIGKGAKTGKNL